MSKPAAPAAPNPVTTAQAQTASNEATAVANTTLGNTNQVTPYGTTDYTQTGGYTDPTTGQFIPSSTETTSLDPSLQNILSGTESAATSLVPTAQTLASQAASSTTNPLNVNTANNSTIAAGPQALDPTVANAEYQEQMGFLAPTEQQQQTNLQDQLSQQGISVGNQGYSNAETQLMNSQNQANTAAANNAVVSGANQANNMYGLAVQGQNQNIAQQQTVQQQPLSLLSQLYGTSASTSPTVA
jgi:hypothetical protein